MAAPVLAAPFKYSAIGKDVVILPSVAASTLIPTRSEINAGTNIKLHLDKTGGLTGFTVTPNSDIASALGDGVGYPVSAGYDYGTASFMCHQDSRGPTYDVRSVFTEGTTYYTMVCDTVDTGGLKADMFAVLVRLIDKSRSGVSMLTVSVDIQSAVRSVTIPA